MQKGSALISISVSADQWQLELLQPEQILKQTLVDTNTIASNYCWQNHQLQYWSNLLGMQVQVFFTIDQMLLFQHHNMFDCLDFSLSLQSDYMFFHFFLYTHSISILVLLAYTKSIHPTIKPPQETRITIHNYILYYLSSVLRNTITPTLQKAIGLLIDCWLCGSSG